MAARQAGQSPLGTKGGSEGADYIGKRIAPAEMQSRDAAASSVRKQQGNAIGGHDAEQDVPR